MNPLHRFREAANTFWWWLRQMSGDAAYENYLRHAARLDRSGPDPRLSREEFYLDALRRRYSDVSRCC